MNTAKWVKIVGYITFAVLFFLCFFYYEARTTNLDNAFQTFLLICEGKITVMAYRWPATVVRFLPYLLSQLHADLDLVMMSFSFSYVLMHFIAFLLLVHYYKRPRLVLMQLFLLLLACSDGFFWCNSELIQGLSVALLFKASIDRLERKKNVLSGLIAFIYAVLLNFYHPILLFPVVFLLIYDQLYSWKINRVATWALFSYLLLFIIKSSFFASWYDKMKSNAFAANLENYWYRFWEAPMLQTLPEELFYKFHFIVLGLLTVSIVMLFRKKWLSLLFILAYCLGFFFILLIGEPDASYSFYNEINYYPFLLFVFYPLLFESKHLANQYIRVVIIALLLFSIGRICFTAGKYYNRMEWIYEKIATTSCNKTIIKEEQIPQAFRLMNWGLPHESLLISRKLPINKSLHTDFPQYKVEDQYASDIFITQFKALEAEFVETYYFDFPDGEYCYE
ncbi:MAG: hypothetical protein AAFO07_23470 [Bacteroidota bacterium]